MEEDLVKTVELSEKSKEKIILIKVPFIDAEEFVLNYFNKEQSPKIVCVSSSKPRYFYDVQLLNNIPEEHEISRYVLRKNLVFSLEDVLWKTVTRFDLYHITKKGISICVEQLTDGQHTQYRIISNILT